jgi:hypothetical protein
LIDFDFSLYGVMMMMIIAKYDDDDDEAEELGYFKNKNRYWSGKKDKIDGEGSGYD